MEHSCGGAVQGHNFGEGHDPRKEDRKRKKWAGQAQRGFNRTNLDRNCLAEGDTKTKVHDRRPTPL